jgi:hypothetical protein
MGARWRARPKDEDREISSSCRAVRYAVTWLSVSSSTIARLRRVSRVQHAARARDELGVPGGDDLCLGSGEAVGERRHDEVGGEDGFRLRGSSSGAPAQEADHARAYLAGGLPGRSLLGGLAPWQRGAAEWPSGVSHSPLGEIGSVVGRTGSGPQRGRAQPVVVELGVRQAVANGNTGSRPGRCSRGSRC